MSSVVLQFRNCRIFGLSCLTFAVCIGILNVLRRMAHLFCI